MSDQSQKVTGSSVAIQSGRDTTINQGLTATDMKQIIEAIASQHTAYAAVARELVDARLTNFEQRILERFANPNTARSEAFKDPDFQYTFSRAQIA